MNNQISAVIICLNAADTITKAISSLQTITDNIIVADSGSTDGTQDLVAVTNAKLINQPWQGYGPSKNLAGSHAKYNWLLSLDADEYLPDDFTNGLQQLDLQNENQVFQFKRVNFLGKKAIRYGEWSRDKVIRLFNKNTAAWDASPVHEQLTYEQQVVITKAPMHIYHRTATDIRSYQQKIKRYAKLMAEKNFANNKKVSWAKIYLSPLFNFIQNYILRLGFLDGKEGWQIAMAHAGYTYDKYSLLQELYKKEKQ
ncbi:MAG: glycosyltransferase family 2 protein [Chitinophagaceae bacterium]